MGFYPGYQYEHTDVDEEDDYIDEEECIDMSKINVGSRFSNVNTDSWGKIYISFFDKALELKNDVWSVTDMWDLGKTSFESFLKHQCVGYENYYHIPGGNGRVALVYPWGCVRFERQEEGGQTLSVTVFGFPEEAQQWHETLSRQFKSRKCYVEWHFIADGQGTNVHLPVQARKPIEAAFPWLDRTQYSNIDDYIDSYLNSDESILILIGPPGTGKTSFIKHLLVRGQAFFDEHWSIASVTYDMELLKTDRFFAEFMTGETNFLIVEDADTILSSRMDGNQAMQKFLNLGDGLMTLKNKKIVFSTNLPNVRDIDEALLRPGRCFDVMHFRSFNQAESLKILEEVKRPLILPYESDRFTLAELMNRRSAVNTKSSQQFGII